MSKSTHDTHDKTSLKLLIGIAMLIMLCVFGFVVHYSPLSPTEIAVKDGCTIYRFRDEGSWHYYVNCPRENRDATTYKVNGNDNNIITVYDK